MAKKDWMVREADLDDDQLNVMQATLDKSCIVSGCAGSGKSVLALIKAQRIQKEKGDNYQIIVFTKSLCNYMNSGREALGLHNTFTYEWQWRHGGKPKSDYIIVDEIQDFSQEEISDFINAAGKNFFFFGDTAQSIYNGMNGKITLPVDKILYAFPHQQSTTKSFELYRNYRLPLPVAKMAQHIGKNLPPFVPTVYQSKEKQLPYLLQYNNTNQVIEDIIKTIKDRNLTDVGIFLPTNEDVEQVVNLFKEKKCDVEYKYNKENKTNDTLNFDSTLPKVMTYHSAKGLQFEAVFIPMISLAGGQANTQYLMRQDGYRSNRTLQMLQMQMLQMLNNSRTNQQQGFSPKDQTALYVAITRTYHYLYLMYTGSMPHLFANIPKEEYLTTTDTMVEDK